MRTETAVVPDLHPDCWVCSPERPDGLGLVFRDVGDGVETRFDCAARWTGYTGLLHGGLVCTLLDAAMARCLLRLGVPGVTADLQVRFREPVRVGREATVRARTETVRGRIIHLSAELEQDGGVRATAVARFMTPRD